MYVCSPNWGIFWVKTMTPTSLRQLVELWREVNTHYQPPSVFISQKFKNCEDDKLEVYEGRIPVDQEDFSPYEGWILFSTVTTDVVRRRTMRTTPLKIYQYKRITPGNTVDFQLKPPVKSQFTAISGPYKAM